jgi:excisionase family DNA binding protein
LESTAATGLDESWATREVGGTKSTNSDGGREVTICRTRMSFAPRTGQLSSGNAMKYLKTRDVAEFLNCSISLVYDLIASEKLGHVRIGQGRGGIRVSDNDLQAFLESARKRDEEPLRLRHITLP